MDHIFPIFARYTVDLVDSMIIEHPFITNLPNILQHAKTEGVGAFYRLLNVIANWSEFPEPFWFDLLRKCWKHIDPSIEIKDRKCDEYLKVKADLVYGCRRYDPAIDGVRY